MRLSQLLISSFLILHPGPYPTSALYCVCPQQILALHVSHTVLSYVPLRCVREYLHFIGKRRSTAVYGVPVADKERLLCSRVADQMQSHWCAQAGQQKLHIQFRGSLAIFNHQTDRSGMEKSEMALGNAVRTTPREGAKPKRTECAAGTRHLLSEKQCQTIPSRPT